MSTKPEKFGAALAKAIKGTAAKIKDEAPAPVIYRVNRHDVALAEGLGREDGWVDAQVRFLVNKKSAGADHVIGWAVLKPGARHENHRHHDCDAFFIVLKGYGHIYTDRGEIPSSEGDVVYAPHDCWHGFDNTSDEEVVLAWGLLGAGSIADSGYQSHPQQPR